MKKVLIIDDSALMRRVLSAIIETTNEYHVAYTASDGEMGMKAIFEHKDDIVAVICDLNMPKMNGLEVLENMNRFKIDIPFILFSSSEDAKETIIALEKGAIEFIKKPDQMLGTNPDFSRRVFNSLRMADSIITRKRTKAAATVLPKQEEKTTESTKVDTTSIEYLASMARKRREQAAKNKENNGKVERSKKRRLVALCCSTGGPKALQSVIPKLPKNLAAPVLLVQHMPAGFTMSLANRLNEMSNVIVKEACDGEKVENGVVYIAQGGMHLKAEEKNNSCYIKFDDAPPVVGLKPCGNLMYRSLADFNMYDEIVCVVLTGMGADGTKGIVEMGKKQKIFVIAQDEASSTVYGMPKAIYEAGVVDVVCDLQDVADEISKKVGVL